MPKKRFLVLMIASIALFSLRGQASRNPPVSRSIEIEGTPSLGTEVAKLKNSEISAQLIAHLDKELGASSPACTNHESTKQNMSLAQGQTDETGIFRQRIMSTELKPVTHPSCVLESVTPDLFVNLRVRATMRPTPDICRDFCAVHEPSNQAGCRSSCEAPDARLLAEQRFSGDDLKRQAREQQGTLKIPVDLDFNRLSPSRLNDTEPDLILQADAVKSSIDFIQDSFRSDSCAVQEGCVLAPGNRRLLTFDSEIVNIGGADLIVGAPEGNPTFEYSSCHKHPHLHDFMTYELYREGQPDTPVVTARKQAFCIMDSSRISGDREGQFDCDFQGITSGWSDLYDRDHECQWLDITDIPPGNYRLKLTVNPTLTIQESNLGNNTVEVPVVIPASP